MKFPRPRVLGLWVVGMIQGICVGSMSIGNLPGYIQLILILTSIPAGFYAASLDNRLTNDR
mgnify:CR=1 FL=1